MASWPGAKKKEKKTPVGAKATKTKERILCRREKNKNGPKKVVVWHISNMPIDTSPSTVGTR